MIRPIVRDSFFLSQISEPANEADRYLADDLEETLLAHQDECVGMAANMIGVTKRVIIVNTGLVNLVMFNPVLLDKTLPFDTEESCLSLDGNRSTRRYQKIRVRFLDKKWCERTLTLTGLPAQICQHELDHLDGIVI